MTSASVRSEFRSLSAPARLLVINQFGISLGFYMVLPFLAVHMGNLGHGAAVVGLVLGLRTLSQQGMFPIGGVAADRIGCRPMIIAGCALRVVAFGMFAAFTSLPGIITATVLTGLGSALFNPAARTYLMAEAGGGCRAQAFAVDSVFADAGALVGRLLGALLLTVDFRVVALVAGVVFAVLTVAQLLVLPPRAVQQQHRGVLGSWWEVVTNRRFVAFALFCSAELALYNQLYLALPVEAERVTGSAASISAVFVLSTVATVAGQVRITAWCQARWSAGTSVAVGLAVQGAGFLPLMISSPWLDTDVGAGSVGAAALAAIPVLIGTLVFTVGLMITFPFVMTLLPVVGSERLAGTYYGVFYLVSAITTGVVSWLVGGLIDLTDPAWRWSPGAALLAVGLAAATGIAIMQRRGTLDEDGARGR